MKKLIIFLMFVMTLPMIGCVPDPEPEPSSTFLNGGYTSDDLSQIPSALNVGYSSSNLNVPSSVDLSPYFPPIGNQESYGTCVGWATAYNMMSALDAVRLNLSSNELTDPSHQFSAKDLFLAIPDNAKGGNCNGTNFESALGVIQQRGVATMATVPYQNLNGCSQSNSQPGWQSNAAQHKIKSYRKVEASIDLIKAYISKKVPIVFGADVDAGFQAWRSSDVLDHPSGAKAGGHALAICGYDDSKGPNGAFKIVNSWGGTWGNYGFVWIDYNYFINQFCKDRSGARPMFVVDDAGSVNPPTPGGNTTGVDLAAWAYSDMNAGFYNGYPVRQTNYNIFNIGTSPASVSSGYAIAYLYYNAYNGNDYGIFFLNVADPNVPAGTAVMDAQGINHFNASIPAGSNLVQGLGWTSLTNTYIVPNISGDYYIVLIADATNKFNEQNENNNYFYTTSGPKRFTNGQSARRTSEANLLSNFKNEGVFNPKEINFSTAVDKLHPNAYTPGEIRSMLVEKIKSGDFMRKFKEQRALHPPQSEQMKMRKAEVR
jgi:C1A family cysteine protease